MGDFNPSSPTVLGTEWRPTQYSAPSISGTSGYAMRIRPGAVTISDLHLNITSITGAPTVGLEVVSSVTPTFPTSVVSYPATDVTNTNWTRSTGAGTWFSHVDDWTDISDSVSTQTLSSPLEFRSTTTVLSGKRIGYIDLQAYCVGGPDFYARLLLNIGGTRYYSNYQYVYQATTMTYRWYNNPATGLPWTQTAANLFLSAGTDEFGIELSTGTVGAAAFTVFSMRFIISYATENRLGFVYTLSSGLSVGWRKYTLGGTSACSANTYYWVMVFMPPNNTGSFNVPILIAPSAVMALDATASTGEHRFSELVTMDPNNPWGTSAFIPWTGSSQIAVLLDSAGTIRSQSCPYVELDSTEVYSGVPAAQFGQEFTTPLAPPTYGGVKLSACWQTSSQPDAPLLIKLRTVSFTGTVQTTATLDPTDPDASASFADISLAFSPPFVATASTQYFVTIDSAATNGKGWKVATLDMRSDVVTTTTAANIEGTSQGGTTDAASLSGSSRLTRYDLAMTLGAAPTAPASITATARAGT